MPRKLLQERQGSSPPADLSAAGEWAIGRAQQLIGYFANRMTLGSTQKQRSGEVKCTLGILDSSLVFGMVIKHIYHPQKKQSGVEWSTRVSAKT